LERAYDRSLRVVLRLYNTELSEYFLSRAASMEEKPTKVRY